MITHFTYKWCKRPRSWRPSLSSRMSSIVNFNLVINEAWIPFACVFLHEKYILERNQLKSSWTFNLLKLLTYWSRVSASQVGPISAEVLKQGSMQEVMLDECGPVSKLFFRLFCSYSVVKCKTACTLLSFFFAVPFVKPLYQTHLTRVISTKEMISGKMETARSE